MIGCRGEEQTIACGRVGSKQQEGIACRVDLLQLNARIAGIDEQFVSEPAVVTRDGEPLPMAVIENRGGNAGIQCFEFLSEVCQRVFGGDGDRLCGCAVDLMLY